MNGKVFSKLISLKDVWLVRNDCISSNSFGAEKIRNMAKSVTQNCIFAEIPQADLIGVDQFFNFECGQSYFAPNRMANGIETERGEWPFLVALKQISKQRLFCGGSLITSQHVLTGKNFIQSHLKGQT